MENKPVFYPGHHVLVDYHACPAELLNDADALEGFLIRAAEMMRASIVSVQFNRFNPIGVSGVIIIAESHLTIHTWPEHGFAAVDFFTCGDMPVDASLDFLKNALQAKSMDTRQFLRGAVE
jgi:S-adenosylmethionine decarboxylase proenzyme